VWEKYLVSYRSFLQTCKKYQPEDCPQMVETCSWLTYYFYKVVFLTAVNLLLFILQHKGIHKVKITSHDVSRLVLLRGVNFKHQELQKGVLGWWFLSRLIVRRNSLLTVAEGIHHQFGTRLNLFQCYVIELAIVLDTLHSPDDFAYSPTSRSVP